ncbi:MAG: VOC family protein [Anaerolineae bacterium]|nr:VOC family protein [Anaerolineae bacterium]
MAPRALVHVEIPAGNRDQAADFYHKALGITSSLDTQFDYLGFNFNDTSGGAFVPLSESVHAGRVVVYFSSPDIDADLKSIEASGGKVVLPRMQVGDMGAMAMFQDPTGNIIGLWQSTRP